MKAMVKGWAAIGLVIGLALSSAGTASASATGRTLTRFGVLELQVVGKGVRVTDTVGRLYARRCNMEFRLFGIGRTGRPWQSRSQIARCPGIFQSVWVKWPEDFEFAPNTKVCLKVGETGKGWEPYYACIKIKP